MGSRTAPPSKARDRSSCFRACRFEGKWDICKSVRKRRPRLGGGVVVGVRKGEEAEKRMTRKGETSPHLV